MEKELAGKDPKIAEQVKAMMAGFGPRDAETKQEEVARVPRETCKNCMEPCEKLLRCGLCKSASYCSAKCQKEDWQFHKRTCKKLAVLPKAESGLPSRPPALDGEQPGPTLARPQGPEKEVVAGEDLGTWYSHRQWRPSEERKEFRPEQVDAEVASRAPETASAWNAAGTWEEKSMLPWWTERLRSLKALAVDSFAGRITVDALGEVTGEAQIVHIRGTPRFLFDLHFHIDVSCKYPRSSRAYKGQVRLLEFSHDAGASEGGFRVQVTAESDADKRAIEQAFVPKMQAALRECIAAYQAQVAVPAGGAFPGQLPPACRAAEPAEGP